MIVRSIAAFGKAAVLATGALILAPPAARAEDAVAQAPAAADAPAPESKAGAQTPVVANPPPESPAPADDAGTGIETPQTGGTDAAGQASDQPPAASERSPGRQAVDRFLRNPAGLLQRHPLAGQGLVNEVRLLAVTDVATVEELIALTRPSSPAVQQAIGRGLAAAALALVETNPETAAKIQELVAESGLTEVQAAFLGRQDDVETFALGAPAAASGGGAAGDVGGGESGGGIGGSAGTGSTGSNLQSVTASGSGFEGGGTGFLAGLSGNGGGSNGDGNPTTIVVSPTR